MGRKVFLIDDDTEDRELFCEAMEEAASGIECFSTDNGRKALMQLMNKEIETPDVIFLDINMPLISGWQVLSKLKEHEDFKNIPVIMYSTASHAEEIDKAFKLGAFCFFTKPFDYKDLKNGLAVVADYLQNNSLSSLTGNSSLFILP